jgi:hypothetical protein
MLNHIKQLAKRVIARLIWSERPEKRAIRVQKQVLRRPLSSHPTLFNVYYVVRVEDRLNAMSND